MLQAAVNGTRKKTEHSAVPQSPEELSETGKKIFAAGAGSMHFHVYDENGVESLSPHFVSQSAITQIKKTCPNLPIGISTGEWIAPDLDKRIKLIESWQVFPDFASVNMNELGAIEISKLLISKGIKIEAGISDLAEAEVFLNSDIMNDCVRILIEPFEEAIEDAVNTFEQIEKLLNKNKIAVPRLLHGFNSTAWEFVKIAFANGYNTRIGLEDILYLSNGNKAKDNADLINDAFRLKSELNIS